MHLCQIKAYSYIAILSSHLWKLKNNAQYYYLILGHIPSDNCILTKEDVKETNNLLKGVNNSTWYVNSLPFWNYDVRVIEKFWYNGFKPQFEPLSDSLKLSLEGDYLSLLSLCFPIWKMKIIVSTSQSYHWN